MIIRVAESQDIETLFHIRTSVKENYQSREEIAQLGITPKTVAEMLQTDCCAWVANIENQSIGFSIANATERTIFGLFVLPDFEGLGAGRKLLEQAEAWLWKQGNEEIGLLTENNPKLRAYGFYLHLGWIPTEPYSDDNIKLIKRKKMI